MAKSAASRFHRTMHPPTLTPPHPIASSRLYPAAPRSTTLPQNCLSKPCQSIIIWIPNLPMDMELRDPLLLISVFRDSPPFSCCIFPLLLYGPTPASGGHVGPPGVVPNRDTCRQGINCYKTSMSVTVAPCPPNSVLGFLGLLCATEARHGFILLPGALASSCSVAEVRQ